MSEFAWTAENLYELVKDLPDGARPEHIVCDAGRWRTRIGDSPDHQGWPGVPSQLVLIPNAVLAHTASVLGWLATMDDLIPVVLYIEGDKNPWTIEDDMHDQKLGSGPTLLHALCAAAKAVAHD